MAVWQLMVQAMQDAHDGGRRWLTRGEVVREVHAGYPETNAGTVSAQLSGLCINDPSKDSYPGPPYRRNPLFVTDDPTMHGKRYRLLTEEERAAYLGNARADLQFVSYSQLLEWLKEPHTRLAVTDEAEEEGQPPPEAGRELAISGPALLEMHLQDYLFRNWEQVFPDLRLYEGAAGREFVTADPSVGILDFLCTDADGNFVVIETKRDVPDRQAVGQILGYMGWVQQKLCPDDRHVRGLLIAGDASDRLRMAVAAVPNLDLRIYEITFDLKSA